MFLDIFNQREYVSLGKLKDSDFIDVNIKAIQVRGDNSKKVLDKTVKVNKNDIPFSLKMDIMRKKNESKSNIKITKKDILGLRIPESFSGLFKGVDNK